MEYKIFLLILQFVQFLAQSIITANIDEKLNAVKGVSHFQYNDIKLFAYALTDTETKIKIIKLLDSTEYQVISLGAIFDVNYITYFNNYIVITYFSATPESGIKIYRIGGKDPTDSNDSKSIVLDNNNFKDIGKYIVYFRATNLMFIGTNQQKLQVYDFTTASTQTPLDLTVITTIRSILAIPGTDYLVIGGDQLIIYNYQTKTQMANNINQNGDLIIEISVDTVSQIIYCFCLFNNDNKVKTYDYQTGLQNILAEKIYPQSELRSFTFVNGHYALSISQIGEDVQINKQNTIDMQKTQIQNQAGNLINYYYDSENRYYVLSTFQELPVDPPPTKVKNYRITVNDASAKTCNWRCEECDAKSESCTKCKLGSNRQGIFCSCRIGFYENHLNQCQKCPDLCAQCNSTRCLQCISVELEIVGTYCKCKPNSFYDRPSAKCLKCDDKCATCEGSAKKCTSCRDAIDNRFLFNYSECRCQTNFYEDTITNKSPCLKCKSTCNQCVFDTGIKQEICIDCYPSQFRTKVLGLCSCIDGYFDSGADVCVQCDRGCLTCKGAGTCETCNPLNIRELNATKQCVCQQGFYDDTKTPMCKKCHHLCKNCTGPTEKECTECYDLKQVAAGECVCLPGYFLKNEQCLQCHYQCKTCNLEWDNCTECDPATNRELNSVLGNNKCLCKTHFYDNGVALCDECDSKCENCVNKTECLTCRSTDFRNLHNKTCICIAGYTEVGGAPLCVQCDPSCIECDGDAKKCTKCRQDQFRTLVGNDCKCIKGYFQDGGLLICQECNYSCETCETKDKCLTCAPENFRVLNPADFLCICIDGFFNQGIEKICKQCHKSCKTCDGPFDNNCNTCFALKQVDATRKCECLIGYFPSGDDCLKCHFSCETCINVWNNCLKCKPNLNRIEKQITPDLKICDCSPGFFFSELPGVETCEACDDNCLECHKTKTFCTACKPNLFRELTNNKCECIFHYMVSADPAQVNGVCVECNSKCKSCQTAPDNCLSCFEVDHKRVLDAGKCNCIKGFYENGGKDICEQCIPECENCVTTKENCTSCVAYYFRNAALPKCTCIDGFFDDKVNSICKQCHLTCKTCDGPADINCLSCYTIRKLDAGGGTQGKCICGIGFYPFGVDCLQCHHSCYTCEGTATHCLQCKIDSNRDFDRLTNKCDCKPSFFDNGVEVCEACDPNCLLCKNSKTFCTACDTLTKFTILKSEIVGGVQQNTCVCLPNYVLSGVQCLKCNDMCETCIENPNKCTKCYAAHFRLIKDGINCDCMDGYFQEGPNLICSKCHPRCLTCQTNSETCITCEATHFRTHNPATNKCDCNEGFYDDGGLGVCKKCHYLCKKCVGPAENQCTECYDTKQLDKATNTCVCIDGYFAIDQACFKCHYSCEKCVEKFDKCLSCRPDSQRTHHPLDFTCFCNKKFYDNGVEICDSCDPTCEACIVSKTMCTECRVTDNRILLGNACVCLENFIPDADPAKLVCVQCNRTCKKCDPKNIDVCLECYHDQFRYFKDGKCECLDGYYQDRANTVCAKCNPTCLTCIFSLVEPGNQQCSTCEPKYFRFPDAPTTKCDCIEGFYNDTGLSVCKKCDNTCKSCKGPNPNDCLSCFKLKELNPELDKDGKPTGNSTCGCVEGYFMSGTSCLQCHYSCKSCVEKWDKCLSCKTGVNRSTYDAANFACQCDSNFFNVKQEACAKCDANCLECIDTPTNCIKCRDDDFRMLLNNKCICKRKFLDDPAAANGKCLACNEKCAVCAGDINTCTECEVSQFRILAAPNCICKDGYFDDGKNAVCQNCSPLCLKCVGTLDECLDCNALHNRSIDATNKKCVCIQGFYHAGIPLCQPCHYTCKNCTGPQVNQCTECQDATNRTKIEEAVGSVYCRCNPNFQDFGKLQVCTKCHYSCKECNGPSQHECKSCDETTEFRIMKNNSECHCKPGYYNVPDLKICQKCHFSCLECINGTAAGCTKCVDSTVSNRSFNSSLSLCQCLEGFYEVGTENCAKCHFTCQTCEGPNSDNCLSCYDSQDRQYKVTIFTQPDPAAPPPPPPKKECLCKTVGFYLQDDISKCVPCHFTCLTCQGPGQGDCLSCTYDHFRKLQGNQCVCDQGYFEYPAALTQKRCGQCHYTCKSCTGLSFLDCTECNPFYRRTLAGTAPNTCLCDEGFYNSPGVPNCQKCHFSCKRCLNGSINSCLECWGATRALQNVNVYRQCKCLPGYYETSLSDCQKCHQSCVNSECDGPFEYNCLSCAATDFRKLIQGNFCSCEKGYFALPLDSICTQCNPTCLRCEGDKDTCLLCDLSKNMALQDTKCLCKPGYALNPANNLCEKCHLYCETCELPADATNCLSCRDEDLRVITPASTPQTAAQCICINNFFNQDLVSVCAGCHFSCTGCDGPTSKDCLACDAALNRVPAPGNKPTSFECQCKPLYNDFPNKQKCEFCHYSCDKCSGQLSNNCTSCGDPAVHHRQLNSKNQCVCEEGFYDSEVQTCQKCHYSCKNCVGPTPNHCIDCDPVSTFFRIYDFPTSSCQCLPYYFDDVATSNKVCQPCHYSCQTCAGPADNQCLLCDSLNLLREKDIAGPSKCVCKTGYYDGGLKQCQKCHYTCETCIKSGDPLNCTKCGDKSNRDFTFPQPPVAPPEIQLGQCICKVQFYDNGTQICGKCHPTCQSCTKGSEKDQCDACDPALNRKKLNDFPMDECICLTVDHMTLPQIYPKCILCHRTCLTCKGEDQTDCVTCDRFQNRISAPDPLTGRCLCLQRFFDPIVPDPTTTQRVCKPCDENCFECSGPAFNQCISCDINDFRILIGTECKCLDGYFQKTGDRKCQKCHSSCSTCNGPSEADCYTCSLDNYRIKELPTSAASRCLCIEGYYHIDNNTAQCGKCSYKCKACTTATNCTKCDLKKFRQANPKTNTCDCVDGYYDQIDTETCQPCHFSCFTCIGKNEDNCTSCDAKKQRVIELPGTKSSKCLCNGGYYAAPGNVQCLNCYYSCKTCIDAKISDCLTCPDSREIKDPSVIPNECVCKAHLYDVKGSLECSQCDYSCKKCNDNYNECIECDPLMNRQLTPDPQNKCLCQDRFYDVNGTPACQPCHYTCQQCVGDGSSKSCIKCSDGDFRYLQEGQCKCSDRYYDDFKSNTPQCSKCHYSCLTCSNEVGGNAANKCLSCNPNDFRVFDENDFTCKCMQGYYDDGSSFACIKCNSYCKTCNGNQKDNCLTCEENFGRQLSPKNECRCQDGFYEVANNPVCQKCHYSCKKCIGATDKNCSECEPTDFRTLVNGNECQCLAGYYNMVNSPQCGKCDYRCQQCTSDVKCTTCDPNSKRTLDATGMCICNPNFHEIANVTQCSDCHYSCEKCDSPSRSSCTLCNPASNRVLSPFKECLCNPRFLDVQNEKACKNCHYSCLTCSAPADPAKCLTCSPADMRIFDPNSNSCLCQKGFFDVANANKCGTCHYSCMECSGGDTDNKCQKCSKDNNRYLDGTTCKCIEGYFEVAKTAACQKCDYSCKSCVNAAQNCLTCDDSKNRIQVGNKCICKPYTYDIPDQQLCNLCHPSCFNCTDKFYNTCSKCDPLDNRELNGTQCSCLPGFYEVADRRQCVKCHYSCQSCVGFQNTECNQCNPAHNRAPASSRVTQCLCQQGFFDDGTPVCKKCHYSCKSCDQDGPNDCLSCDIQGTFRELAQKTCQCIKRYYDNSNLICEKCHKSCYECNGSLENNCVSCSDSIDHRFLDDSSHTCKCKDGYFNVPGESQCEKCHNSCRTCFGGAFDNCIDCRIENKRELGQGNTCRCLAGYYDNGTPMCALCNYTCLTCSGGLLGQCTSCETTKQFRYLDNFTNECKCIEGYYPELNISECQKCHPTCASCYGPSANNCNKCSFSDYRKLNENGYCVCDDGYFQISLDVNQTQQVCVQCNPTCFTCSQYEKCTSCRLDDFRELNSLSNKCECIDNYFVVFDKEGKEERKCQPCLKQKNKVLNRQKTACVCEPGYYQDLDDITETCKPCHFSCNECDNYTQCTSCNTLHFRELQGTNCIPIQGYFDIGKQISEKCADTCKNCINMATNCISCRTEDNYTFGTDKTSCVCKDGYKEIVDVDTGIKVCRSQISLRQSKEDGNDQIWFYIFLTIAGILVLVVILYLIKRQCFNLNQKQQEIKQSNNKILNHQSDNRNVVNLSNRFQQPIQRL